MEIIVDDTGGVQSVFPPPLPVPPYRYPDRKLARLPSFLFLGLGGFFLSIDHSIAPRRSSYTIFTHLRNRDTCGMFSLFDIRAGLSSPFPRPPLLRYGFPRT